jgi:hypothetical protein
MKSPVRKGVHDIRTRSSQSGELENPQRKYLRAASLELKKSLCSKVRDAAKRRAEEMDEKIADLDDQQTRLLAVGRLTAAGEPDLGAAPLSAGQSGLQPPRGFALKY